MARVINKTKGFGTINRDCVFDNQLSDRARFVYVYMACKPETWDFYQDKVADELGYKKDTLRKYLDELIVRGWLTENEQQNDGKFGCLEYIIEVQRKKGNLPIRKKPDTEKTRIGKSSNHINIDNISSDKISSDKRNIDNKKRECNKLPSQKKVFVKPTIEQIAAYINNKGYHFDAEQFWNHYESVGWMIGKNHMKDWHCACATWECRRKQEMRKEEKEENADDAMTDVQREKWKKTQAWLKEKTPTIAPLINYDNFNDMMARAHFKSPILAEVLIRIESDGCDGDIVQRFTEIIDAEYYDRIWNE